MKTIQQQAAEGRVVLGARYVYVRDARIEVEPKGLCVRAWVDADKAQDADLLVTIAEYAARELMIPQGAMRHIALPEFRRDYRLKA